MVNLCMCWIFVVVCVNYLEDGKILVKKKYEGYIFDGGSVVVMVGLIRW